MNHVFKSLCATALIAGVAQASTFGKTFFNGRSQGVNLARQMSGQAHHVYLPDTDYINGSIFIAPEYVRSFRGNRIGEFLFFNGTDTMKFGPAAAAGTDVFARNFLLNDNFEGFVKANPTKQDVVVDLNLYLGLDEWVPGLFFRVDAPIVWTRWNMDLSEDVITAGTTIAANRLGNTVPTASPFSSIIEAWKGHFTNASFPAIKEDMKFGKIDGARTQVGVADVTFNLGYNFILNDCGHFGAFVSVIAPTGNRPTGEFVFEPIVGNGHHVGVGGGLTGHYELWNNGYEQSFGMYFEGSAYHLFRARQHRLFDLKNNGIGSRYLWFKEFDGSTGTPLNTGKVVPGANVTRLECNVKNDVQGQAALMFDYRNCGLTFDVGYEVWGRTRDKVSITQDIPANTFGVQGDTLYNTDQTQSLTTINGNFLPAVAETTPVTITNADLDPKSAEHPGALSHKVFTNIGYTWENCDYLPFVGVGAEVEFSGINNNAFDQWGLWVKGGFTFS